MTNREKFKEVFNKDIHWSRALEPQILALKSAYIDGINCMEEWLNAEYKEPTIKNNLGIDCISSKIAKEMHLEIANMKKIVQALSSVTPTSKECSDCISRAYLLDDSKYHTVFNDDTGNFEDVVYREDIEKAPPVTPIRPKGYWVEKGKHWYCSCCNEPVCEIYDGKPEEYFCPNCGADMREEEKE